MRKRIGGKISKRYSNLMTKINNININSKLLMLISLFGVFIFILGALSIGYIKQINKSADYMYKNNTLATLYISQINEKNLELTKLEVEYVLSNYSMDKSKILNDITATKQSIPELYNSLTALELTAYTKELLLKYDEQVDKTNQEFELVKERVKDNRQIEAYMYFQNRLTAARQELLNVMSEIRQHNLEETELVNASNKKSASNAVTWMLIIVTVILALASAIFTHIFRAIKYPIQNLSAQLNKMKQGDLGVQLDYVYDNELGLLSKDFLAMSEQINMMVHDVKVHAQKVTTNSTELLEGTTQMEKFSVYMVDEISTVAGQAEVQVQHMNESLRALEEVAKGISRINESTFEVSEQSSEASRLAQDGMSSMQMLQKQMQSILKSSSDTFGAIERFEVTSLEIEKFIRIIEEISSQVQLLALNASIEAARAGEHGRGFAVVASEVRELANHTQDASKSITKAVKDIQKQAKTAVQIVAKEQIEVKQGIEETSTSEVIFNRITDAVQTISSQLQEVSASTEQMSASAQQVTSSLQEVTSLSHASSQKAVHVAELAKQQQYIMSDIKLNTDDLAKAANGLNEQTEKFKIRQ